MSSVHLSTCNHFSTLQNSPPNCSMIIIYIRVPQLIQFQHMVENNRSEVSEKVFNYKLKSNGSKWSLVGHHGGFMFVLDLQLLVFCTQ